MYLPEEGKSACEHTVIHVVKGLSTNNNALNDKCPDESNDNGGNFNNTPSSEMINMRDCQVQLWFKGNLKGLTNVTC